MARVAEEAGPRRLIVLGSGTSTGVPVLGCDCAVCRSPDPRNARTRASVLLELPGGNVLFDTTPEMRLQLLRERVGRVSAIVYTHYHADHLFGLRDAYGRRAQHVVLVELGEHAARAHEHHRPYERVVAIADDRLGEAALHLLHQHLVARQAARRLQEICLV